MIKRLTCIELLSSSLAEDLGISIDKLFAEIISGGFTKLYQYDLSGYLLSRLSSKEKQADKINTTNAVTAKIIAKENGILAGVEIIDYLPELLQTKNLHFEWLLQDGEQFNQGQILVNITSEASLVLLLERTILNFLQTLSGTASSTKQITQHLINSKIKLLDTRKTIPTLRAAQKYAVRCGGGHNHRAGLYDQILLKENHITVAHGIEQLLEQANKDFRNVKVAIEVENLVQLQQVLQFKITNPASNLFRVILDNFDNATIAKAIKMREKIINNDYNIEFEVSGGINLERLKQLAEYNLEYISLGSITKNLKAVDMSLIIC